MRSAIAWISSTAIAVGCGGAAGSARAPSDLTAEEMRFCAERLRPASDAVLPGEFHEGNRLYLFGVDPAVRGAIADRVRRGRLAVLALSENACNVRIDVLACTRTFATDSTFAPAGPPEEYALGAARYAFQTKMGRRVAGIGAIMAQARNDDDTLLRIGIAGSHALSLRRDMGLSAEQQPLGWKGLPLDESELVGPDCARATHFVTYVYEGRFEVVNRTLSPPSARVVDQTECRATPCSEPIEISVTPIGHRGCPGTLMRTPAGCAAVASAPPFRVPPPTRIPGYPCIPPQAGRRTPEAAAAHELLRQGRWLDAANALVGVANGSTGDDAGNQQLAQYHFAVAAALAGDPATAKATMEAIVATGCHLEHREASAWLTVMQYRTTRAPSP